MIFMLVLLLVIALAAGLVLALPVLINVGFPILALLIIVGIMSALVSCIIGPLAFFVVPGAWGVWLYLANRKTL